MSPLLPPPSVTLRFNSGESFGLNPDEAQSLAHELWNQGTFSGHAAVIPLSVALTDATREAEPMTVEITHAQDQGISDALARLAIRLRLTPGLSVLYHFTLHRS